MTHEEPGLDELVGEAEMLYQHRSVRRVPVAIALHGDILAIRQADPALLDRAVRPECRVGRIRNQREQRRCASGRCVDASGGGQLLRHIVATAAAREHELADLAAGIIEQEQLAVIGLAECRRRQLPWRAGRCCAGLHQRRQHIAAACARRQRRDHAAAEVREDVASELLCRLGTAIDVPTGYREAHCAAVLGDRIDEAGSLASARRFEAVRALASVPAVISSAVDDVDLLEAVLTDIGEP